MSKGLILKKQVFYSFFFILKIFHFLKKYCFLEGKKNPIIGLCQISKKKIKNLRALKGKLNYMCLKYHFLVFAAAITGFYILMMITILCLTFLINKIFI